jgi:hypothetical protein
MSPETSVILVSFTLKTYGEYHKNDIAEAMIEAMHTAPY